MSMVRDSLDRRGPGRLRPRRRVMTMAAPSTPHGTPMRPSFAQMRNRLQSAATAAAFAALLSLAGCASTPPPTAELDAARQAVARADAADATQYARDAFDRSRTALSQAQAAMSAGREDEARTLAVAAAASADLATARARGAAAEAELSQRRAEVTDLRRRLESPEARR